MSVCKRHMRLAAAALCSGLLTIALGGGCGGPACAQAAGFANPAGYGSAAPAVGGRRQAAAPQGQWKGNTRIENFDTAKKLLYHKVYNQRGVTFYCGYPFSGKEVQLPGDFSTPGQAQRSRRIEWEHVVPAENFGRAFPAWREGDPLCMKGDHMVKGRKCAEMASPEFRLIESDMYNLFPAVGSVNALRSNYRYDALGSWDIDFGSCPMHIDSQTRRADPPAIAKGPAARATLYMEEAYPVLRLSDAQRRMMTIWSNQYPVTAEECRRTKVIEGLQGNENMVVKPLCRQAGLW